MRYEIGVTELKNALGALTTLIRKMPAETRGAGAEISLMRTRKGGYRLVTTHSWFHASVSLPGISCLSAARGQELDPWDGDAARSAWGLDDPKAILSVVAKLPKAGTVTLTRKSGESKITMESGGNKAYEFPLSDASRSLSGYGMHDDGQVVCHFDEAALDAFCTSASEMSALVSPSVTRPEFESLCLSSERVGNDGSPMRLRLSVNVRDEGLSLVETRADTCEEAFTALLPKETATGLKGFVSQLTGDLGAADLVAFPAEAGKPKSKGVSLRGDNYELYLSCRTDDFPFAQVSQILDVVATPSASVREPAKEVKGAFGRVSVLATKGVAALTLSITDAGALSLEQHQELKARTVLAREVLPAVTPECFPGDETVVATNVNSNTLAKGIKFVGSGEVSIGIVGQSGQGILVFHDGESVYDGMAIVLAAVRI